MAATQTFVLLDDKLVPAHEWGGAPRAINARQGTCPREWVAAVGGLDLRGRNGAVKRYSSAAAALKAALKAGAR